MKIILNIIVVLSVSVSALAQPDTLWTRTYGDAASELGYCVQQTEDGGYITLGYTVSDIVLPDYYLLKTDEMGNEIWNQTYGGDFDEFGRSVLQTSDGGYVLVGYAQSFGVGGYDIWMIKTDDLGNQQWYQTYGGYPLDYGYCVQQTTDGGFIIVGKTISWGAHGEDVWLVKTDQVGDMQWFRLYGRGGNETGYSVQQTSDGGYIIAGQTTSFGAGFKDAYLIKTDSLGNEQWSNSYGGDGWDVGYCVQQTSDGGYIMVGRGGFVGTSDDDVFLLKVDSNGNQVWRRNYGGTDNDYGKSVQQTIDGGYIIAGSSKSFGVLNDDVYIIKTDANGNEQWSQRIGGNDTDRGTSVRQTFDGGFIVAGYTYSFGADAPNIYLIRLEAEEAPDLTVTLTPENPPIQIPAGGGTFDFNLEVVNNGTTTIAFDLWTMATLPDGSEYGPILMVENYELNAGMSISRDRMQYVPMNAPSGNYIYDAFIGNYPNVIWDEDHFEFVKEE